MNDIKLIGRVGDNPDVHTFDNGKIANVSLATTERGFKGKDGKEVPDRTDWHRLVFRGGLAEVAEKYVKKGSLICVSGRLTYREYERDGKKMKTAEIWARDMELLDSKPKSEVVPLTKEGHIEPENTDGLPF